MGSAHQLGLELQKALQELQRRRGAQQEPLRGSANRGAQQEPLRGSANRRAQQEPLRGSALRRAQQEPLRVSQHLQEFVAGVWRASGPEVE